MRNIKGTVLTAVICNLVLNPDEDICAFGVVDDHVEVHFAVPSYNAAIQLTHRVLDFLAWNHFELPIATSPELRGSLSEQYDPHSYFVFSVGANLPRGTQRV